MDEIHRIQQTNDNQQPFDPLTTVHLPPPNDPYNWTVNSRAPPGSMLRTPQSIIRPELEAKKRQTDGSMPKAKRAKDTRIMMSPPYTAANAINSFSQTNQTQTQQYQESYSPMHPIAPAPSMPHFQYKPPAKVDIPAPADMPSVVDDGTKPTYSYAMLIGMAILRSPDRKLTLSQIYKWIMDTFAYYRNTKPAWHNSIRHNLSLNKAFEKRVRPKGDPGKGNYWTIVDGLEHQFVKPKPPKRTTDIFLPRIDADDYKKHLQHIPSDNTEPEVTSPQVDRAQHHLPVKQDPHFPNTNSNHAEPRNDNLNMPTNAPMRGHASMNVIPQAQAPAQAPAPGPSLGQGPGPTGHAGPNTVLMNASRNHYLPSESQSSSQGLDHEPVPSSQPLQSSQPLPEPVQNRSMVYNDWRAPHALFRCSTPSLLPSDGMDVLGIKKVQPYMIRRAPSPDGTLDVKHLLKVPVTESPRTPEKSDRLFGQIPSLLPPKSYESSYAGTLDLSPGLLSLRSAGSPRSPAISPIKRRVFQRAVSSGSLCEFLELEMNKPMLPPSKAGHERVNSNSSNDSSDDVGPNHLQPALVHASPRMIMTPIRRPFDTPIRDQTHVYSPYCRAASSFGSPTRAQERNTR